MNDTSKTELDAQRNFESLVKANLWAVSNTAKPLDRCLADIMAAHETEVAQREQAAELRGRIDEVRQSYNNELPRRMDERLAELQATKPEKEDA